MAGRHAASKRRKREVEDDDFAKMVGRMLNALERRASENPDALAYLLTVRSSMDDAVTRAGYSLYKERGFSLGELSQFMTYNGHKMSRQAAQQRWGKPAAVKLGITITQKINNVIRLDDWRAGKRRASTGEQVNREAV